MKDYICSNVTPTRRFDDIFAHLLSLSLSEGILDVFVHVDEDIKPFDIIGL